MTRNDYDEARLPEGENRRPAAGGDRGKQATELLFEERFKFDVAAWIPSERVRDLEVAA